MSEINSILKEPFKEYQFLINHIMDVIVEIDLDGNFSYVSPQVKDIFGYQPEEVIGNSFFSYIHPDDRPIIMKPFEKALTEEKVINLEIRVRHKQGHYVPVYSKGSLVRINNKTRLVSILRKTSEIKLFELKLKESEKNYKKISEELEMIMDHVPGLIFYKDTKNNFIRVNKYVAEAHEMTKKQLENKNLFDLYPKQQAQDYWKDDLEVIRSGKPKLNIEELWETKKGQRWVNTNKIPFINEMGEIGGIIGFSLDITEKKLAEQKLKESEKKYRMFIENAQEGIWAIDENANTTYVNRKMSEMLGYNPDEMIGKHLFEFMDEHDLILAKKYLNRREQGIKEQHDFEFLRKDGSKFYTKLEAAPIFDYNGKYRGAFAFISDITERKISEEKLKESEEKYRMIFNGANEPIGIMDEKNIVDCNDIFVKLFKYNNKDEIIGIPPWKISPIKQPDGKDSIKRANEFIEKALLGESQRFYWKHMKKDGTLFDTEISLSSFKLENKKYLMAMIRDITERKKAERELREINQLKTELLERTSHELKTPLISIKGFTELILELHKKKLDNDIISILQEIRQGTERLETIINKLLITTLLDSGKYQFQPRNEDLSFLIKFCVKDLRGLAKTRNHFIKLDIPDKLFLNFEKERIYEVVTHLIINAIKYTPPFGEIKVQVKETKDNVIISVQDNGIGLLEDEQKKIFKQFGKIERYGQGWDIGTEGTGMGLYTSKKIVELHGGEIWVESEGRNKGAKFCFSLPLNKN